MKLLNPSDDQLNACFAEKVAGWINQGRAKGVPALSNRWVLPDRSLVEAPLQFTNSADAVYPFLPRDKFGDFFTIDGGFMGYRVCIRGETGHIKFEGQSESGPKAIVLALLRAHGVEVEFTT